MENIQAEMSASPWIGRGNLKNLVQELERQKNTKIDFITDTRHIFLKESEGDMCLHYSYLGKKNESCYYLPNNGAKVNTRAFSQLAQKCEPSVPAVFARKLMDQRPGRASELVNHLMEDKPSRKFIRMLDGNVRAFLSDSYRVLDNYDLALSALKTVREVGGEIVEASLSESHMKIKFTSRTIFETINEQRLKGGNWFAGGLGNQEYLSKVSARTEGELPGGPGTIHPLIVLSNSETGNGGFKISTGILKAICFNLAIVQDCVSQIHLGEKMASGIFSQEALSMESKAIQLKARDMIRASFLPETFKKMVLIAKVAQNEPITDPIPAVNNIVKNASLTSADAESILSYFLTDYDRTRYGLSQSVARLAQDKEEANSASYLEEIAGNLMRSKKLLEV